MGSLTSSLADERKANAAALVVRKKLEQLCRELQRQNKLVEETSCAREAAERGKRVAMQDQFEGRSKIPLATKNLLEVTDGLRRPLRRVVAPLRRWGDAIHQRPLDAVALCFC